MKNSLVVYAAMIMAAFTGSACDRPTETIELEKCVLATAEGLQWTLQDVDELMQYVHPPLGGVDERRDLLLNVLTAHSLKTGSLEDYEPGEALKYYREILADYHYDRSFEEATRMAKDSFSAEEARIQLSPEHCEPAS